MIGLCRTLPYLVALPLAFATTAPCAAPAAGADEVTDLFKQGIETLQRGNDEEALKILRKVLALDPTHEAALEIWQATDHKVWMDLLAREGDFERVALNMMALTRSGRKARENDPDAIREILKGLMTDSIRERKQLQQQLAADHGEYAVPQLLYGLADQGNDERRITFMLTLQQLGGEAVQPLLEALNSDDAFLRQSIALVLRANGDKRANGTLAWLATTDPDPGVRDAANEALARMKGDTNALDRLLYEGNAYHVQDPSVLRPHQVSNVVWVWEDNKLTGVEVPPVLYNDELAKKAYYRALQVDPGSIQALAGIARSSATERAELNYWSSIGEDIGDWAERLVSDELTVRLAGSEALDTALGFALDTNDQVAASGLIQALAMAATTATPNLTRAISASGSGAIRGEAAVALAYIAVAQNQKASDAVIGALSESVARKVVRIAGIIDGDDARRNQLSEALRGRGLAVNAWPRGGRGLAALRSIPGIDVLLVADDLPDLTIHQVIRDVRRDARTKSAPILGISQDPEGLDELYGDRLAGTVSSVADLETIEAAMSDSLNPDRELANDLAARSAAALRMLALSGAGNLEISSSALVSALDGRPDAVTVPSLGALGYIGSSSDVDRVAALLTDDGQSDEVRLAAAESLRGIFGRGASLTGAIADGLFAIVTSDAPFEIRAATASALGRLNIDQDLRAKLMRAVRSGLHE